MHIFKLPFVGGQGCLMRYSVDFGLLPGREGAGCLTEMEKLEAFSHKSELHLVLAF